MIKAKRIIAVSIKYHLIPDSIKYHLIPQVFSKNNPKYMFDSLTKMYEGKNINQNMNLRTQLKNTKMQKGEIVQDYFSMVFQFNENLEAIGYNLDEYELIMKTLNGLTRPWDAFIQTICARKEKLQFDSLWEECFQEEARVSNQEAILLRYEDQALALHAKGGKKSLIFKRRPAFIRNLTLQRDSINNIRVKERENICPPINVIVVIRLNTLLRTVVPEGKNTRGEIKKYIMLMQLNLMRHPRS
jgi:hypothetical protein